MTTTETEIKEFFEAGTHFGFAKSRRHPTVKPYIFGTKNNIEIFDLEKTVDCLKKAKDFVKKIASEKGQILYVGGKSEAQHIIKNKALSIDMPYVAGRWIGGTITNFSEIRKRVEKLENLLEQREKGELAKYTKKERLLIDREIDKLTEMFEGLIPLKSLPKAMFIIDPRKESTAVNEAKARNIPIVSLAGSDCDLSVIDYPIPANDASVSSIDFIASHITEAYKEGLNS